MQGEDSHAHGHSRDDKVLVQGIPAAKDGDVEEHNRQQLAALCKEERDVVDMRKRRVAKRTSEAACDGD